MTIMAPASIGESLDPRDPLLRLSNFFDDGSVQLLHERDQSGVLAAAGTVNGMRTIAFCTDILGEVIVPGVNPPPDMLVNDLQVPAGTSAFNITADGVLRDADLVASLAPRNGHRPLVVIDDGWQDKLRFPDMAGLASAIRDRPLRPGIWIRPTRAPREAKPSLLLSPARFAKGSARSDLTYDPTIPEALEAILDAVHQPASWGYGFLKHDFST